MEMGRYLHNIFPALCCLLLLVGCGGRQRSLQLQATAGNGADGMGGRVDSSKSVSASIAGNAVLDEETVRYELPECQLRYTQKLPVAYKGKKTFMWTEHTSYNKDVQAVNLFVANPASDPLAFGRGWKLDVWDGKKWIYPEQKAPIYWQDDQFRVDKAPLLYCFRLPVGKYYYLPRGRYRITKKFTLHQRKWLDLHAEFEVK